MAPVRNLFSVGRRRGDEDQLTEMLVWLAEAVPAVATALIQLALEDRNLEMGDVTLTTQHGIVGGRLDAYLTTADVAVIVESKLGSTYGGDQIRKYLSWLSSEAVVQRKRALVTLTAVDAPWPPEDVDFARAQGVRGSARRWEELHEVFEQIAADPDADPLRRRLIVEFLDMIAQEGLIPTKPLIAEEMGVAWSDAWQVITRYRDYFHSCRAKIAETLEATPTSGSSSDRGDWFWQDFSWPNGSRLAVGFLNTDLYERLPPGSHTGAPIVWLAPQAEPFPMWNAAAAWLDQHQPEEWRAGNRWYGRPTCWQYSTRSSATDRSSSSETDSRLPPPSAAAGCSRRSRTPDASALQVSRRPKSHVFMRSGPLSADGHAFGGKRDSSRRLRAFRGSASETEFVPDRWRRRALRRMQAWRTTCVSPTDPARVSLLNTSKEAALRAAEPHVPGRDTPPGRRRAQARRAKADRHPPFASRR